ncbi:MAG: CHRD domain-containing protein [Ktedonobacterales bacterium]
MDTTQASPDHMTERNRELNERWTALPWAAWHDTGDTLHMRVPTVGKGKRVGLRLLSGTLVMVVVLLVFSGCAAAQNAVSPAPTLGEGSGTLVATLTPEGTNTHGTGTARLQLNSEQQTICSVIHVAGIELPATAAHIHQGASGINGPIVVHLPSPNAQGVSTGCTHAPRNLIVAIMQHPADYYVNVHNIPYPMGAVRGQLSV